MSMIPIALSVMAALTLSHAAIAADLAPMQERTFRLGDHIASVYYLERGKHYDVVTTIAAERGPKASPVRFVASLEPGEAEIISVGAFDAMAAPHALELTHDGSRLVATMVKMQVASR